MNRQRGVRDILAGETIHEHSKNKPVEEVLCVITNFKVSGGWARAFIQYIPILRILTIVCIRFV